MAASASAALIWSATGNAAVTAPHFVNVFPSRDFVHIEGYEPGSQVTVTVHHDPNLITSLSNSGQDASVTGTVGSDGIFEVNHVGAACWSNFTPDIRPGDTVTVSSGGLKLDDMVVQNVAGGRPIQTAPNTIVVHGTAANADGSRPDVAVLGSRLINPTRFFSNGGKRNLNAPSVTYDDATSDKWTATYEGLADADIDTALSADTSATWSVTSPAGTPLEATAQETGANAIAGPTAGCSAPAERVQIAGSETVAPTAPTNVAAAVDVNTVTVTWDASTDPVSTPAASGVQTYGVFRDAHDGQGPVEVGTVQNADGSNNPPTSFTDVNVPAGTYRYSVRATDAANNDSPAASAGADVTALDKAAPVPDVTPNDPPAGGHLIIGFPARDFISADGYTDAAKVDINLVREGNIVSTANDIVPQGATGLVEVNHPGGGCWVGNTPYLQPGDVMQTVAKDGAGNVIAVDQTKVANVTAERPVQTVPGTIVIHGTAVAADGGQIPVDQLEQRLVTSSANAFTLSGKRTIRADSTGTQQGTLTYDGAGSNRWTATYKNLTADDVTRALGAESRGMWLGRDPVAGTELTIFENSDAVAGGPGAPCTAPAAPQPKVTVDTTAYDFGSSDVVDQTKPRPQRTWTVKNDGQQPLTVDHAYIAGADSGSFKVASDCDGTSVAPGATCTATVTFDPKQAGVMTASLNFADNAKIIGFQSIPLSGTGIAGTVTANVTSLAFNTVTAGSPVTKSVAVKNNGGTTVNVDPSISGAATGDFTVAKTDCAQLAPGASCNIDVKFNPTATGSRTATLEIPNDSGTNLRVALTGTGVGSTFTLSPTTASFGTINRNSTKTQTITVKNSGTLAFKVGQPKLSGTGATAYSVSGANCIGTTLAAGRTCNLTVTFRPTAAATYTATLDVYGDASSLPAKVSATLTGSGK